jgi:hypothetical protein
MKKIILILLMLPAIVSAHGLNTVIGQNYGENIIEFEYDTIGNIIVSDPTVFFVYFMDKNRNNVQFDNAYVNISKSNGSAAIVVRSIEDQDLPGRSKFTGVLSEPGDYKARVLVYDDNNILSDTTHEFKVTQAALPSLSNNKQLLIYILVGLIVGIGLGSFIRKRKK